MPRSSVLSIFFWTLLAFTTTTHGTFLSPFLDALEHAYFLPNSTSQEHANNVELVRRQDTTACPTDYGSCSNLGAPQLCCASSAVCSADYAGNVACCPTGAACTGTIASIISGGTIGASGTATSGVGVAGSTTTTTGDSAGSTTTSGNGLILASVTTTTSGSASSETGGGFVIDGSSTVATVDSGAIRRAEMPLFAAIIIRLMEWIL